MTRICFVCLGNICRSPTAEGVLCNLLKQANRNDVTVGSFGTGAWHAGEAPDSRAQATARRHGVEISHQRAAQFTIGEIENWDVIVAMDRSVQRDLLLLAPAALQHKVQLLGSLLPASDPQFDQDVIDPYYHTDGFEQVYQMILRACQHWLQTS